MKKLVAVVCAVAMTLSTVSMAFAHSASPTEGTTVENQTNPNAQPGTAQPTPSGRVAPAPQAPAEGEGASAITIDNANTAAEIAKIIADAIKDGYALIIESLTREDLANMNMPAELATAYSAVLTVEEAATNAENYAALLTSALASMNAPTEVTIKDKDGNVIEIIAFADLTPLTKSLNISLEKEDKKEALLGKVTKDDKIALDFTLPAVANKKKDKVLAVQFVSKKGEVPEGESKFEVLGSYPKNITEKGLMSLELPSIDPMTIYEKKEAEKPEAEKPEA